jgi:hypothetical protein
MAVDNIRSIFAGLFASHVSPGNPTITAADWAQSFKRSINFLKPIADASAGATTEWPIFHNHSSQTMTVTGVKLVPFAALTADNTNYKTVAVNRRTDAGSATVIASRATTITDTGNWVALTPITLTLSATAADLVVPAGADLTLHLVHAGSGVAVPVCAVTIEYIYT